MLEPINYETDYRFILYDKLSCKKVFIFESINHSLLYTCILKLESITRHLYFFGDICSIQVSYICLLTVQN